MIPFGSVGDSKYMASIGDLNHDGISDIALGNIAASPGGRVNAGQVYVLFGGQGTGSSGQFRVPNDMTAEIGLIFNGISAGDSTARVAPGGDVNGDGIDDLIISSRVADTAPDAHGQVYVVYGGEAIAPGPIFELADLDGSNGFMINGPAMAYTGESIAGLGDINGDGYADVGVSVNTSNDWVGIVFGGANDASDGVICLENVNGENGFKLIRVNGTASSFGLAKTSGDISADGVSDLFVRLHGGHLFFGASVLGSLGIVAIEDTDGRVGFDLEGGRDRAHGADFNDDGIGDVIIGSTYQYDNICYTDLGQVHVLFGRRMGDGDLDADVDFADFGGFQKCCAAQLHNTNEDGDPDVPDACHPFDFDKDNDVDLDDYAAFQSAFGTPP